MKEQHWCWSCRMAISWKHLIRSKGIKSLHKHLHPFSDKRFIQYNNIHTHFRTQEWSTVKKVWNHLKIFKLPFEINLDFKMHKSYFFQVNLDFKVNSWVAFKIRVVSKMCQSCTSKPRFSLSQLWNQVWIHELPWNQGCLYNASEPAFSIHLSKRSIILSIVQNENSKTTFNLFERPKETWKIRDSYSLLSS